jgi:rSAM/selenodomain-associated transferase 1
MTRRLYFAAKAPRPGQVKTRLAAAIGEREAALLYRAFVADLAARFEHFPVDVAWYVAPGSWPELEPLAGRGGAPLVREQAGDGWAERQAALFPMAAAAGETEVVLAATDSPQLRPGTVAGAFAWLAMADVVLGPTPDGGYYLVGMRSAHDVFTGTAMSTPAALEQVLARARRLGLRTALLPPAFDVDVAADLPLLRAEVTARDDLPHTAAALAAIGRLDGVVA